MNFVRWLTLSTLAASVVWGAEAPSIEGAMAFMRKGDSTNAIATLSAFLKEKPEDVRAWHLRAQMRGLTGDAEGAISDFGEAIRRNPKSPYLVEERGMLLFRRNEIEKALIDFDRANELDSRMAPQNWQRGIALYYAGKFAEGRKQFELHQTVNPDDVENAVWHFLCTAREQGVEAARKQLIPIRGDTRIPMKEIHDLFASKATPEDVLAAAAAGEAAPADRRNRTFYAHLYLGLYFEALGDAARMREHILASLPLAARDDYMGDVARVHAQRLTAELSPKSK